MVHKLGFFTFIHHEIDFGSKMNAKVNNQSKQWQNNREQISRLLPIELSVLITQLFESGVNMHHQELSESVQHSRSKNCFMMNNVKKHTMPFW